MGQPIPGSPHDSWASRHRPMLQILSLLMGRLTSVWDWNGTWDLHPDHISETCSESLQWVFLEMYFDSQ